jgi:hypothetical protein
MNQFSQQKECKQFFFVTRRSQRNVEFAVVGQRAFKGGHLGKQLEVFLFFFFFGEVGIGGARKFFPGLSERNWSDSSLIPRDPA